MTLTLSPSTDTDAPVEPGTEAPANGSLKPVIDLVPDEAYENPTWKGLAYFGRDLLVYGLVVWGLIVVANPFAVLALWVLAALVISGLFVVGHDAAHGALFSSKRLNSVVGTIAMLPSLARLRGLGARPQPHPPRLHRAPGLRLRVAPVHRRAVRRP